MMVSTKFVVMSLVLFTIDYGFTALDFMRPKTIRIDRLDGKCKGYPNLVVFLKDLHISMVNKLTVISTKVVAEKNVYNPLKLQLILKRCKSKEALDSCELYQTVNINHLCDLLNAESTPWAPFVKNSKPRLGCPILKGVRTVTNGTFDGSAFSAFPVSGWYWKGTAKVFDEIKNDVLSCTYFEGQVIPI